MINFEAAHTFFYLFVENYASDDDDWQAKKAVKWDQSWGKSGAAPSLFASLERFGVHGKVDFLFFHFADMIVEIAIEPFLPEEVAVESPENEDGNEGNEDCPSG